MKRTFIFITTVFMSITCFAQERTLQGANDEKNQKQVIEVSVNDLTEKKIAQMAVSLKKNGAETGMQRLLAPTVSVTENGQEKLVSMWDICLKAGAQYDIDPYILGAIIIVESRALPGAQSPTGPRGASQMARQTGEDMGLTITMIHKTVLIVIWIVRRVHGRVVRSRELIHRTIKVASNDPKLDERLNPAKSIPAGAQYVGVGIEKYEDMSLAIQHYNAGPKNMSYALDAYDTYAKSTSAQRGTDNLWARIYFCQDRQVRSALARMKNKGVDLEYYFRVEAQRRMLKNYVAAHTAKPASSPPSIPQ